MKFVVLTGLPGTGKSEIADAVGRAIGAPVFNKDRLAAPLLISGVVDPERIGWVSYEQLTVLAERQLALGQSVVLDSVATTISIREKWRAIAQRLRADWYVIECVCGDERLHRDRLAVRERDIEGWPELEWSDVERVAASYAAWDEPRLILDATDPLDQNIARAITYVS